MRMTVEILDAFAKAWNRHDIEALMSFMTDDCVFQSSAGPHVCGTEWIGREAVGAGFRQAWTTYPDACGMHLAHFICGDRGVSEWTFTGTDQDGVPLEVNGCDVFTFRCNKIVLKNSYRKNRLA